MYLRSAALAALFIAAAFGQTQLQPNVSDPLVVRAQRNLDEVRTLVAGGALPVARLNKASEDLQDAMDMSILQKSLYNTDLLPEQTEEMIGIAERMVVRRERALARTQELVDSGLLSRSEAEASGADLARAQHELEWAQERAKLVAQIAESIRLEKAIASVETQAELHPEWIGNVYTKYDGI